jgi:hypothetical protein
MIWNETLPFVYLTPSIYYLEMQNELQLHVKSWMTSEMLSEHEIGKSIY